MWLSVRLQLLASAVVLAVALLAVGAHLGVLPSFDLAFGRPSWWPGSAPWGSASSSMTSTVRMGSSSSGGTSSAGGSGGGGGSGSGGGGGGGGGSSSGSFASLAGLSLAYALPLLGVLEGFLASSSDTESSFVAVERLAQACGAPQEREVVPVGCASERAVGREGTRA